MPHNNCLRAALFELIVCTALFELIVLQSENLSGKYAKLHTVATSNNRDQAPRSLYYCMFVPHTYGCSSSRISRSWWIAHSTPTVKLQKHPLLFATNHTDRMFFLWTLHLAQPSHPGHSTILLRSESLSGKSAKLRTMAATNNRDQVPQSLYYCLFVHVYKGVILCAYPVHGESHI